MNKSLWIDNAKAIALIAVIVVHVAGNATATEYDPHSTTNTTWWIANIYDSLFRFCVPVFVMVTGTLLLPQKPMPLNDFLKKRLNRILLPFLFWTLVYIAFKIALEWRSGEAMNFEGAIPWLFTQLTKGAWPHLWYVYMIISLYLFIPIIKPWVQMATDKTIRYFLVIWFFTIIVNQQTLISFESHMELQYFGGYLGYLILGYYISERMVITRTWKIISILFFVLGYFATLFGTYLSTKAQSSFSHAFYESLTVNVLLMSVGLFILLQNVELHTDNQTVNQIRAVISKYGFGIYLAHGIVLSIIIHFKLDYNLIHPWIGIPLSSLVCFILTTVLVYLLDKLPYGKYISR